MPKATIASGEWLAVSTEGFCEQQRGRPLSHLIKELVQNALDSIDGEGDVTLTMTQTGRNSMTVCCVDNGGGTDDLKMLNVVFHTSKKDSVTRRGRMGRGFKELLSIATSARVESNGQTLSFEHGDAGRVAVLDTEAGIKHGFSVVMHILHEDCGADLGSYFAGFLLPSTVRLSVNGVLVQPRKQTRTVEGRLTTEFFEEGRWRRSKRATKIHLVPVALGQEALIYEMGIPVCPVGWPERYHCDVEQRVPMNPNRDAVMSGYAGQLRAECLPALLPELTQDRAQAPWVAEAATSERLSGTGIGRKVVAAAFGDDVAVQVPTHGRFDFNADAEEAGATVVNTKHMAPAMGVLLKVYAPTTRRVAENTYVQRAYLARKTSYGLADIEALDMAAAAKSAVDAERAINGFGRDVVLDRMKFASWFGARVLRGVGPTGADVTVRVSCMGSKYEASWSVDDVLTLSLSQPAIWSQDVGGYFLGLIIHEVSHHLAFHHGRNFTTQLELCASVGLELMLRTSEAELRLSYPALFGQQRQA